MNATNFFYYSVGAFAIIGIILMLAISLQVYYGLKQVREILSKINKIKVETETVKERAKLGILELISYVIEKIKGRSDLGKGGD